MPGPSTYYPRQDAAAITQSQALLDYWALIGPLKQQVDALAAAVGALPGFEDGIVTEDGEFITTEDGDTLVLES